MERLRWVPGLVAVTTVFVSWSETLYYPTDEGPWWLVWWYLPFVVVAVWLLPGRRLRWHHVALAGWVVGATLEGTLVPVLYENVPGSLVYPVLGWHALVSALVGTVAIGATLRSERQWVLPLLASSLGVGLGAWWPLWLVDGPLTTTDVVVPITVGTVAVGLGHLVLLHVRVHRPPTWAAMTATAAIVLLAAVMTVAIPTAPLWLTLALAAPVLLLLRARRADPGALPDRRAPERSWRTLWLALVPVMAAATWTLLDGDPTAADLLSVAQFGSGAVVGVAAVVSALRSDDVPSSAPQSSDVASA